MEEFYIRYLEANTASPSLINEIGDIINKLYYTAYFNSPFTDVVGIEFDKISKISEAVDEKHAYHVHVIRKGSWNGYITTSQKDCVLDLSSIQSLVPSVSVISAHVANYSNIQGASQPLNVFYSIFSYGVECSTLDCALILPHLYNIRIVFDSNSWPSTTTPLDLSCVDNMLETLIIPYRSDHDAIHIPAESEWKRSIVETGNRADDVTDYYFMWLVYWRPGLQARAHERNAIIHDELIATVSNKKLI